MVDDGYLLHCGFHESCREQNMRGVRFPGLRGHRPLSDAEFVEKTRKRLQSRRSLAWFGLVWLMLAVPSFLYLLWPLAQWLQHLPDEIQHLGWAAVGAGFFYGGCVGPFMMVALFMVLQGFGLSSFGRGERLLVEYYDALQRSPSHEDTGVRPFEGPGC
jgi:hypothetical protein